MPYRYSRYRRQNRRRYRRYPRTGTGMTDIIKTAKAAYNGVKYLKSIVNVEKHALYTNNTATNVPNTGVLECLNLIAQGDLEINRQGDSIMMKKIHINVKLTINSSASNSTVRTILFLYKQPQGATPTITFILNAAAHLACWNHDNVGLYQILYDKSKSLSITGTQELTFSIDRSFYQLHETFDGTAASVADIQTNAMWIAFIADESVNEPVFAYRAELFFIDN